MPLFGKDCDKKIGVMIRSWVFSSESDNKGGGIAQYLDDDEVCVLPVAEHMLSFKWGIK